MTRRSFGLSLSLTSALAVVPVPQDLGGAAKLTLAADKLDQPLGMGYAPGDPAKRLFIVEKTGAIRVLKNGAAVAEPFLNLKSRVSRGSEQGLLGLAFDRDFMTSGKLYVNYTDRDGDTRIIEFTVAVPASDRAEIKRERELLKVDQPYSNHNGGNLVMTSEGWLLVGLGDGGSGGDPKGNGQNPKALLAKMFRLDPTAESQALRTRILAFGMRNPWRYALDRKTNDLYIGDVGQNKWEEIDVVPLGELSGRNFGWNIMEGLHCYAARTCDQQGLTPPVVEYGHDAGCSVTGGVVYRGKAIPSIDGTYFYSDYCTSFLRSFRWTKDGGVRDQYEWKKALDPKDRVSQVASFGEDEDGEIYVISLSGQVWKLIPAR